MSFNEDESKPYPILGGAYSRASQDSPECPKTARERTAQEMLTSYIDDLHSNLRDLEVLQRALPIELPYPADRALRRLLTGV